MIMVGNLLRRPVVALPETAAIREVAVELVKNRVGLAVLTARGGPKRPVAVVSERDALRAVAERREIDGHCYGSCK